MKNSKSGIASRLIRLSFALAFILPWSASSWIASNSATQETGSLSLELLAPAYRVQSESDGLTSVQADGFTTSGTPGGLALPHRVLQVALPPQADLDSVTLEISSLQLEALPGVYQIQTLPPDSPDNALSTRVTNPGDSQQAAASGFARLLSSGQMRKWRFVSLDHSPFAYDPASGELSLASRVLVTIHYKVDPSAADLALLSDDLMDDLAQSKFYNYEQAQAWYPVVDTPDQPGVVYDYVIITTNAIEAGSNKLDDFILHKQNRGFSVLTITESEYGGLAGQSPNGTAEKIRKWLQDNYVSFGIHYVLLVGNPDPDDPSLGDTIGDLPMKMCWPRRTASDSDKNSPTDYFYADLTGNWDKDGDGYFGEYTEDQGTGGVDFAPEVYVGRIPVYSAAYSTLDAVLQKIMDYENEASPLSWRKNALLPMSYGAAGYDGAPLAEQMMDDYLDGASFTSWTQYQQGSGACSLDSTYTSSQELRGGTVVRDRWAANDYGLVLWWGHGSQTTAAVGYDSCWDGTLFDITQTSSLDDDHPSFVYQNSCTNGYPENSSNLQYSLLKQGAVASVSASRVSWFNTGVGYGAFDDSTTNSGIGYEYAQRLAAGQSAAEALYNAKSSMSPESNSRLMNFYDFNLYGDPATYMLPPASPAAFNKTSPGNAATGQPTSLTLSWQSTSPVTRYEYCYDTSNDSSCASWTNNNLQTSASLGGLSNNTTYYWQVRAWNGGAAPTYANSGSWWNFTVGSGGQATNDYLPLVMRSAPSSSLVNGNFEQGPGAGWQEYSSNGFQIVLDSNELSVANVYPHSGNWAAWLGGANNETSRLYQQVTVPTSNPTLTFWYWIGSTEYCSHYYDTGRVLLGGATLVQYDLCSGNATGGWVLQNLGLSAYAGQILELEFRVVTDVSNNSNFFIDDVSFGGSGALSEVPAVPTGQEAWLKPDN